MKLKEVFRVRLNPQSLTLTLLGREVQFLRPGPQRAMRRRIKEEGPVAACLSILRSQGRPSRQARTESLVSAVERLAAQRGSVVHDRSLRAWLAEVDEGLLGDLDESLWAGIRDPKITRATAW